jgi:hypothetical protein
MQSRSGQRAERRHCALRKCRGRITDRNGLVGDEAPDRRIRTVGCCVSGARACGQIVLFCEHARLDITTGNAAAGSRSRRHLVSDQVRRPLLAVANLVGALVVAPCWPYTAPGLSGFLYGDGLLWLRRRRHRSGAVGIAHQVLSRYGLVLSAVYFVVLSLQKMRMDLTCRTPRDGRCGNQPTNAQPGSLPCTLDG